jgi:hypothetical protein
MVILLVEESPRRSRRIPVPGDEPFEAGWHSKLERGR